MVKFLNITKWLLNPFLVRKPGEVKVVVLCIAVATTFWFLNAFNKTYTTTLSYPLTYNFDQEKFIAIGDLSSTVDISLTGQGWDLLKEAFNIDEKAIKITPNKLPGNGLISTEAITDSTKEILSKFEVNKIVSDSIVFNFDYKVSKILKLNLPVDSIKLENGYAIVSDVEINPKEVHITGASKILDTIPENFILTLDEEIDDDFDDEITLKLPKKVIAENNEINISFEIEPYIEVVKKVNLVVKNNSDSLIEFDPERIEVNLYTIEKYKDSISDSLYTYELDLKNFEFEKDTYLLPKLIGKTPDFVEKIFIEDSLIYLEKP